MIAIRKLDKGKSTIKFVTFLQFGKGVTVTFSSIIATAAIMNR